MSVRAPPFRLGRAARQQTADDVLDLREPQLDALRVVADSPSSQEDTERIIFAHPDVPEPQRGAVKRPAPVAAMDNPSPASS